MDICAVVPGKKIDITMHNIPPSVVISQKTFKGFPLFSGSIQYLSFPLESSESRMSLQERPGWSENEAFMPKKRFL